MKSAGLIDKDVLLPDTIFEGGAPPELRGRLVHYQVTGYNSVRKEFELTYRNVHIAADGDMWTIDVDAKEEEAASGNPSTINNAKYDLVWEGACLMTRAHIRVAAREDKERKTAEDEVVVMAEVVEDGPIDLKDLQRAKGKRCKLEHGHLDEEAQATSEELDVMRGQAVCSTASTVRSWYVSQATGRYSADERYGFLQV